MKISEWTVNSAREMRIAKIAGNHNLGPRVKNTRQWRSNGKRWAVMTMNKVPRSRSLYNAINNGTIKNFQTVKNFIARLHAAGIHHGNLHGDNILVSVGNNGRLKLVAINFGASKHHRKIINAGTAHAHAISSRGWRGGSTVVKKNAHGLNVYTRPGRKQPIRSNRNMLTNLEIYFNLTQENRARQAAARQQN